MSGSKIFLGLSVLVWLPYGIWCVFQPGYLAEAVGVIGSTATATTEIRAMYGGLQAGIGALCLAALLRPALVQPALIMLCFLTAGLGSTRLLGLVIDGSVSGYTVGAIIFELVSAAVAITLARKGAAGSSSDEAGRGTAVGL